MSEAPSRPGRRIASRLTALLLGAALFYLLRAIDPVIAYAFLAVSPFALLIWMRFGQVREVLKPDQHMAGSREQMKGANELRLSRRSRRKFSQKKERRQTALQYEQRINNAGSAQL